jgi:hypothetical protein
MMKGQKTEQCKRKRGNCEKCVCLYKERNIIYKKQLIITAGNELSKINRNKKVQTDALPRSVDQTDLLHLFKPAIFP